MSMKVRQHDTKYFKRLLFGGKFRVLLALILALVSVPLIKAFQAKSNTKSQINS